MLLGCLLLFVIGLYGYLYCLLLTIVIFGYWFVLFVVDLFILFVGLFYCDFGLACFICFINCVVLSVVYCLGVDWFYFDFCLGLFVVYLFWVSWLMWFVDCALFCGLLLVCLGGWIRFCCFRFYCLFSFLRWVFADVLRCFDFICDFYLFVSWLCFGLRCRLVGLIVSAGCLLCVLF